MKYKNHQRNHVIIPGREQALEAFLKQEYKGIRHKVRNGVSSNSEDALTWSCFEVIRNFSLPKKIFVLDEIIEDAYEAKCNFTFKDKNYLDEEIKVYIGKQYVGPSSKEGTEVDASIEFPDKVLFFEAKLYSSISLKDEARKKPHDQIACKLRVGLDYSHHADKEFYFIFLDIAPPSHLLKFTQGKNKERASDSSKAKWKSAWWFTYYKKGWKRNLKPLGEILKGIPYTTEQSVANNMGWLTWTDLVKSILRGIFTH